MRWYYILHFVCDMLFRYLMSTAPEDAVIIIETHTNNRQKRSNDDEEEGIQDVIGQSETTANESVTLQWISRSVSVKSSALDSTEVAPRLDLELIIAQANDSSGPLVVKFSNLHLSGTVYIGDATLILENCTITNLHVQREHQRRLTSDVINIYVVHCNVQDSSISTESEADLTHHHSVVKAVIAVTHSQITNTLVNITAVSADVTLDSVTFTRRSNSNAHEIDGEHVSYGFHVGIYEEDGHCNGSNSSSSESSDAQMRTSTIRIISSEFWDLYRVNGVQ